MLRFFRSRFFVACVASTVTALVVGGIAWAATSPVDSSGVIHACYNPNKGTLHLNVTGSCPTTGQRTPITWGGTDVHALHLSIAANGVIGGISYPLGNSTMVCNATTLAATAQECNPVLAAGVVVTLSTTSHVGQHFDHWSGACSGSAPTCSVTMDKSKSVVATYAFDPL
jgi:Divergent InlB B-repeat domain